MHTASAAVLRLYHSVNRLSSTFFRTFSALTHFLDFRISRELLYSIRTQSLCQGLFSEALRAHRGAQSSSSRRELVYSNRLFRVCQALFSRYLSELPDFRPLIALVLALSLSAQIIYQTLPLLSTLFSVFLSTFFHPLSATRYSPFLPPLYTRYRRARSPSPLPFDVLA